MSATILLVDYDPRSISRIRGVLAPFRAHVAVATDGDAAVREFERLEPDLTLIQDLIPRRHGFDLCKELKTTEHGRSHPIVLIAFRRPGSGRVLRSTLCDDVLAKPFDDVTLLDKVLKLLPDEAFVAAPAPAEPPPIVEIEDPGSYASDESAIVVVAAVPRPDHSVDARDWASLPPADRDDSGIEIEIVLEPYAEYSGSRSPDDLLETSPAEPRRAGRRPRTGFARRNRA